MLFSGDGQEQKDEKVDDDEDRRNSQYIPKKGMFYEHDDRIDSGDEEVAKEGGLELEKADLANVNCDIDKIKEQVQ